MFSAEFKADVVAVVRRGELSMAAVAKDFGVSAAAVHKWVKQADIEAGSRPGLTKQDCVELLELKKRNRLLEQEVEILRRAAAYFSQAHLPGK